MRILGNEWLDGYLDEIIPPRHARVRVTTWRTLVPVPELYFVRPRDPRLVWNYVRDIGVVPTIRKVLSRSREELRNRKFVSCGLGVITEVGEDSSRLVGQAVVFIAPAHPRCMERIVLPDVLTRPCTSGTELTPRGWLRHGDVETAPQSVPWAVALAGWSTHSGDALSENRVAEALDHADRLLGSTAPHGMQLLTSDTAVRDRTSGPPARSTRRRKAALFGLGNYAKTIVLPNVRRHLLVECIHEIDPTQIGQCSDGTAPRYDSSPRLRQDERYDAVFVAGFHHGHVDLAVDALGRGAAAVIEKPLATTSQQLDRLLHAMRSHDGRVFACFQRRFSPFNSWIHPDLGVSPGAPISYHATVFEVPLPQAHWYRWRSSASRLVSNGCHWIDHFLFLNGFGAVHRQHVFAASDGTLNVSMELDNGALFTMVLTDRGADRVGMQDHVEVRCSDATATITNACCYRAERRSRIVRSARCDKMASYRIMYDSIARAIAVRGPGDSLLSVERSTQAVLGLDQALSALQS